VERGRVEEAWVWVEKRFQWLKTTPRSSEPRSFHNLKKKETSKRSPTKDKGSGEMGGGPDSFSRKHEGTSSLSVRLGLRKEGTPACSPSMEGLPRGLHDEGGNTCCRALSHYHGSQSSPYIIRREEAPEMAGGRMQGEGGEGDEGKDGKEGGNSFGEGGCRVFMWPS